MVQNNEDCWSPEDTVRVLIASDVHLGYLENDSVRGEDSFVAFEEVLSLAVQYDVDFVLLGGDLFDHAKPSPSCMFKCTQSIRKYCFGDKPVSVELLSDQLQNFGRVVNYEDPNLNISYPILSIHGNHDDPVGQGSVSSLDILSITGLVNYFGKWNDYTHVHVSPVLLRKGETKLSLYGLSHLKDQRLSRLFLEKKVEMDTLEDSHDWFNILVLHQNRADRGHGNYIPESVLPTFLDLVIWGHEHDSQVFAFRDIKRDNESFCVMQPGSTVATSLAAGEALPKHCVLLQLHKKEYIVTPLPLKSIRPFVFKTIVLSEENLGDKEIKECDRVQEFLKLKMEEAIEEANKMRSGNPNQPALPLVRLSVFYEHESQDFNRIRFGQYYNGIVANPNDILIMKREKKITKGTEKTEAGEVDMGRAAVEASDVESLLLSYFGALPPERRLAVLSVRTVTEAVRDYVLKRDDGVFRRVLEGHRRRCVDALLDSTAETDDEVREKLKSCKVDMDATDESQLRVLIEQAAAKRPIEPLDDHELPEEAAERRGRGRGRGRGGASKGARARGRARSCNVLPPPPPPEPERRTPRRQAARKSNEWLHHLATERTARRRRDSSDIELSD